MSEVPQSASAAAPQAQPHCQLDHVVLAAASLAAGVAWCEQTLGITPGPGGEHPLMGTHNRLFDISSAAFPLCFFEIIAINPQAPAPGRARWFGLDTLDLSAGPRLVNVVARTATLGVCQAALQAEGLRPGEAVRASRQTPSGLLQWQILVNPDGRLDLGGALPTLIQWDDEGKHPAARMPPSGVSLEAVQLRGLSVAARAAIGLGGVQFDAPDSPQALRIQCQTPKGPVWLASL